MKKILLSLVVLGSLSFNQTVVASNTVIEKYWSDEIIKSADESEIQWLDAEGNRTLGLYIENGPDKSQGGVILLHEMGSHPNSPTIIASLRKSLPKYGWSTLSLQLPVLDNDVTAKDYAPLFDEVPARIKAAISFLQSKNILNIVIVGYDLGATMGADFLANNSGSGIKGFVAISMNTYEDIDPRMYSPNSLKKISMPVLDIYGSHDLKNISDSATERSEAARIANKSAKQGSELTSFRQSATAQDAHSRKSGYIAYRQFKIHGANHRFSGFEDVLIKRIVGWLKKHAGGISVTKIR